MDSFKKEFDKIRSEYFRQNQFRILWDRKETFVQRPLILYGYGSLCHRVILICNDFGIKVSAICDTNKTGACPDAGLEIISPEHMKNEYADANIFICSYRYADEIYNKLKTLGYSDARIFKPTHAMTTFIHPSDFIHDHLEGYEWAYNFFQDNISKKLVLDKIRIYFLGTELSRSSSAPQYFDSDIINLGANEIFVDGGAFIGDTAEEFIKQTNNSGTAGYKHIYSFEPDDMAREKAIENLSRYNNVDIIDKGLWSCDTELNFFNDGGNASSSFVIGICTYSLPVTSIDNFFAYKSKDDLPTFIKMDIEGAEKEALIGAKNVIRQKHPKLAICTYHKPEDIYELPKLIYDIDPSYQFILRQYADGFYESVLYAV